MFARRSKPKLSTLVPLSVTGTMLSHPGCVREINEDAVAFTIPAGGAPIADRGALALIADGMGGHAAGEVASRIAADIVLRLYFELQGAPPDRLAKCFAAANQAIGERSRSDSACAGMGTTCTALAIKDGAAFLAHIGDSRAYLLREGKLQQISEDHSLVAQLVREGSLTEEEAMRSPERNVILHALGTEPSINPSIWREGLPLLADDAFVLCSDGLSDLVDNTTIAETVARLPPLEACQALIDTAVAAGGTDNVSVGVFVVGRCQRRPEVTHTTRPIELPEDAR